MSKSLLSSVGSEKNPWLTTQRFHQYALLSQWFTIVGYRTIVIFEMSRTCTTTLATETSADISLGHSPCIFSSQPDVQHQIARLETGIDQYIDEP